MLIIIDERKIVRDAYRCAFLEAGVSVAVFDPAEFSDWLSGAADVDALSVEGIVIGNMPSRDSAPRAIRDRLRVPIIVLTECPSLDQTLSLFAAGADDVVRKPVHAREILARFATIRRRAAAFPVLAPKSAGLVVYFDGRDPHIDGEPLVLPRRERRILEFLVSNAGKRVSKSQIFNAIYGFFDEEVDECVVESHISKLRKKLRARLGFDPIDAKRYLGYQYNLANHKGPRASRLSEDTREPVAA
ncbi:MAG: response regulator transcription factor [Beijerinckiaceae bacterium]